MKILVRATNWVGDAVMAVPALAAIRDSRPGAEIVLLARPWVADLYQEQGYADRIMIYENRGRHRGIWGRERLAAELRRERFDVAMLFQNAFDAAWLAWRAGIPERIGYARDARSWLLTSAVPVPKGGDVPPHESYYYLELLHRAGWIDRLPTVERITLRLSKGALQHGREALLAAGARPDVPWIALATGAAYGSAKCWLPERYAELADRVVDHRGADVILFGAPQESGMASRIMNAMRHPAINLVGKTSIADLPALLAACSQFIGNDSGAMHVAGAVGLPVVAIFGPTDPEGTSPVTPQFQLVREPVSCSPCFLRHCPIDHRCMTRISVDQVFAAVEACTTSAQEPSPAAPRSEKIG